jgi:glycine cleavage system H protein
VAAPDDRKYTKTHEWVRVDGDTAVLGITDVAQNELGDITYLELPDAGETMTSGEPFGVVESVKAASDVYSPIDGEVVERNEEAIEAPELINQSPYEKAWLVKVKLSDPSQLDALLNSGDYDAFAEEQMG